MKKKQAGPLAGYRVIEFVGIGPGPYCGHLLWSTMAGHDINYLSITGFLHMTGKAGEPPTPPLNLAGDFGGGSMFLAMGMLAAMLSAQKTGKGDIVDAAIVDGVSSMMGIINSLAGFGQWTPKREDNLLDGGAPFYRCYKTADEKFMAVGCIEPQFFAIMIEKTRVSPDEYGHQNDKAQWPRQHELLESVFKSVGCSDEIIQALT